MRKPSKYFAAKIIAEWGNRNPVQLALVGYEEIISHEDRIDFEHHRHSVVETAIQVGIIAGQSVNPEDFIHRFTEFLNEEQ